MPLSDSSDIIQSPVNSTADDDDGLNQVPLLINNKPSWLINLRSRFAWVGRVKVYFGGVTRKQWIAVIVLCFINLINYMDRFTVAGNLHNILILNSEENFTRDCIL